MRVGVGRWVRYGGVVVAVMGFGITRIFVSEALYLESSLTYLISGLVPLVVGLGLTVYGVALAVGPFSRAYANTVAAWCVIGTVGMLLIVGISAVDVLATGVQDGVVIESRQLAANVLLGGAVGGVLIGTRSATNRRQRREIRRQVNRTLLFNRLLRHEVTNAATIIEGYSNLLRGDDAPDPSQLESIRSAAARITEPSMKWASSSRIPSTTRRWPSVGCSPTSSRPSGRGSQR